MPDKKPNIFDKAIKAGETFLDAQIAKAQNLVKAQKEAEFSFGKAVTKDRHQYIGSQGYYEKTGAITFEHQKQMARKSSVISAILKTRQNEVAAFSKFSEAGKDKGFRLVLKDEETALEKLREELFGKQKEGPQSPEQRSDEQQAEIKKAEGETKSKAEAVDPEEIEAAGAVEEADTNEDEELSEKEIERQLKEELKKRTRKKTKALADFMLSCGDLKDRPFESKKWNFDAFLRALTWDSLIYDQVSVELVPKEAQVLKGRLNIHHFQPIDASTVRFSSPQLRKFKDHQMMSAYDILYPEEELEALEEKDALELDDDRLDKDEYKYVQVIKGRIERAFTDEELCFGMRNPVTDIYASGYSISELELLVKLITSHLHTEHYNTSYFSQGFSAKGILHIKANLNRSKLEELRRHWQHMVKGNRNSFQTPIMSGMQEVQWIPLTQNHSEMEFSLWLNYLIKMICAIYQIDPSEIGYGMKDEGGSGGSGLSGGDNTAEKLKKSKDKGFVPLMRFVEAFINTNIIDKMDPDYRLEWVGLTEESAEEVLNRQEKEAKFKKTVNEIRAEDGLPPIDGCDNLILDMVFFQWWSQFSPEGMKLAEQTQQKQMEQQQQMMAGQEEMGREEAPQEEQGPETSEEDYQIQEAKSEADHERGQESADADHERSKEMYEHQAKVDDQYKEEPKPESKKKEPIKKSVKIEYYALKD